jgi:hypothetical protein
MALLMARIVSKAILSLLRMAVFMSSLMRASKLISVNFGKYRVLGVAIKKPDTIKVYRVLSSLG